MEELIALKPLCVSSSRFIAHLVNQQVAGEIVALEMLALLLETPTDDSVEIAISFIKDCALTLNDVCPQGFLGSLLFGKVPLMMNL